MKKLSVNLKNLKKINRLGVPGVIAAVVLTFFLFVVVIYNTGVGLANEGIQEPSFEGVDISLAPAGVITDAEQLAMEMSGKDDENYQNVVNELVGSYLLAQESDIVIFFNSGGMGWNYVYQTPGWESILNGMIAELNDMGYRPLLLNYSRTSRDFWSNIKEVIEAATRYTQKVIGMEKHVGFLNDHVPGLQFIIAGESTGSVITEEAMKHFREDTNIYSIQTGCPFWYKTTDQPRTLRIIDNGYGVDSFSYGNLPAMVWCTAKGWVGLESEEENAGNVLKSFRSPGHDYSWEYDTIRDVITGFLAENFPRKN